MKKPMSEKSPKMLDAIEEQFPGTMERIEKKLCPICGKPVGEFRDRLSQRKYEISGICQQCQDSIFAE